VPLGGGEIAVSVSRWAWWSIPEKKGFKGGDRERAIRKELVTIAGGAITLRAKKKTGGALVYGVQGRSCLGSVPKAAPGKLALPEKLRTRKKGVSWREKKRVR